MKIRLPNITGRTAEEQLGQVKTYLRQLVQELNWALTDSGPTAQELEELKDRVEALSGQVEQLGKRLQEHIKGG